MNGVESIIQAIVLGITEGATEFLPVSSTGHLIIVRKFLGLPLIGSLAFDAVLQLAAALALVVYFRRDIFRLIKIFIDTLRGRLMEQKDKTLLWAIVLGTLPAVVIGLLLQEYLDTVFRNVKIVALALMAGSVLMYAAQKYSRKYLRKYEGQSARISTKQGIVVGFFQALALVPGISRSGATIAGGLFSGWSREDAVRFSFLLSVPILLGSGLVELWKVRDLFTIAAGMPLFVGSLASFLVAFAAIYYMIRFLKNHNLTLFIWYRLAVAVLILFLF